MIHFHPAPEVKVGILTEKRIRLKLTGTFSSPDIGKPLSDEIKLHYSGGKIEISEGDKKLGRFDQIYLAPVVPKKSSFTVYNVTIGIGFHWQKHEDQVFRGSILTLVINNAITLINILPVEDYLISVVSSEMRATSSPEMLKAHAVISRSWLLAQIEKRIEIKSKAGKYQASFVSADEIVRWYDREDHTGFDVCADDHCQRYQGITRAFTTEAALAVTRTTGEALVNNNRLCDARFSKCCGGITELFENTWEPVVHPYLQRVYDNDHTIRDISSDLTQEDNARKWILSSPSAFCNTTDKSILSQVLNDYDQSTKNFYRWTITYSSEELSALVLKKTGLDFGVILELIPIERGVSGRLIKLRITGTKMSVIIGKELEIRKALSPTHLYSSAFVIDKVINSGRTVFNLHGAGWGHGVGLCQIGAAVMGEKGYSYKDILLHYFRGAEVRKVY